MNTIYAKEHIATFAEELHRAEQYESTQNTGDDYDEPEDTTEQQQDEWMLLCQLQPTFPTL